MPIQHISDHMLRAMNRHGDSAMIKDAIARLRQIPGMTLRTTFIVGFPGETEEDFTELCEFVKEAKFDRLGVFTYSREEDTPAYDFPDQIDEQIKQDRYDIIMKEQMLIGAELNERNIGTVVRVLCEDYDPVSETCYGRSDADAPDIDGKVYFRAFPRPMPGSYVDVQISDVVDYDLFGEAVQTK
jgi:ribosomal protein S12 methylthiotransferase